ncbi:hypothetical protein OBBRIDRAFT_72190 [Obba rivulosa]|uniref:Uncharacterized protein n=1 Tax=Obba rivulosa TaxID=1052685 RepID=A0A8E2AXU5_9APHY|nr:hypothetical protein OBBRIDRAFT_72190 [Obba rivulosa]
MSERGVGKPWTPYEDSLLTQAVALYGECDNWKTVALSVPGRTNKACRKRWLHSLSPSIKKTAWTPEEDQLLLSLYAVHGTKWALIARHIPGRTDDACSKRYREALDPSLKRDEWTPEEDATLLEAYNRLGGRWGQIGQELKRSGLGCRNRWRMLERKKASLARTNPLNTPAVLGETQQPVPRDQSQWAPVPSAVPNQLWDHAVPHYARTPVLENGGQDYEAHDIPFDPELLDPSLRGDDIGRDNYARPPGPSPFQYASSSLSTALGNPPRSHSPSPPSFYSPPFSPDSASVNVDAALSTPDVAPCGRGDEAPVLAGGDMELDSTTDTYNTGSPSGPPQDVSSGDGLYQDIPDDHTGPSAPPPQVSPGPPISQSGGEQGHIAGSIATQACGPNHVSPYYRTEVQKAQHVASRRRPSERQGPPPRLSCNLPATSDPSTLPYACGHGTCWPPGETHSSHRYATSKELSNHYKGVHGDDAKCITPFRCALAGCDRSWKSINGLQYHLQVSKVHFQQALETYSVEIPEGSNVSGAPETFGIKERPKKVFPCPLAGCRKQYKQLSGLRYHLAHGHLQDQPAQLNVIPPGLARKLAEKVVGDIQVVQ